MSQIRVATSRGYFLRVSSMKGTYGSTTVGRGGRGLGLGRLRRLTAAFTVSWCRPSSAAIVPIFQCSAKKRCRIRATVSGAITCSASKRVNEHPHTTAPHAKDRPVGRGASTPARFDGDGSEGRGKPGRRATLIRHADVLGAASVLPLAVPMVEPPALAPLIPAVGIPALKKPGVITTGGAAIALASVARPADPENRAAPRGHASALQKDHIRHGGLTYTLQGYRLSRVMPKEDS